MSELLADSVGMRLSVEWEGKVGEAECVEGMPMGTVIAAALEKELPKEGIVVDCGGNEWRLMKEDYEALTIKV